MRGLDARQNAVLTALRGTAREQQELNSRQRQIVQEGTELGVPLTFMSEAMGLGRTTLGMRMKAKRYGGRK